MRSRTRPRRSATSKRARRPARRSWSRSGAWASSRLWRSRGFSRKSSRARAASFARILRGIFLWRKSEIDWFLYGLRAIFPEPWEKFSGFLPREERGDLLRNYYRRLIDPDPAVHMPAARAWSIYEGSCSTLLPSSETVAYFSGDVVALGLARIEAHDFMNGIFLPENSLL